MSRFKTILVPQGAEYRSVCRGLQSLRQPPSVVAIPLGASGMTPGLVSGLAPGAVLMVGLGGSLCPQHRIGDVVIYRDCVDTLNGGERHQRCDRTLTDHLAQRLPGAALGRGLTSDRLITSAQEKHQLHTTFAAAVVDMEGAVVLNALAPRPVAIVRVISDAHDQDLPNLEAALGTDGSLRPWPLTLAFLRQPLAAGGLIHSSLKGLEGLQRLISQLFRD